MKMKGCLLAFVLLFTGQAVFSQSLKEAKQDLYYNHYLDAAKALNAMTSPNDVNKKFSKNKADEQATVYYYLGVTQMKMDSVDAAAKSFNKAKKIARGKHYAMGLVGLGRIDIANKKYDAAKQKFQKAWDKSRGRSIEVLRGILDATALSPDADGDYATSLVKKFKDDRHNSKYEFTAEDYTAVANVYAHQPTGGGKAATNFEFALSKDPNYAKAAYRLGNLWERARQDSLALKRWKEAADVDSKFSPAFLKLFTYYRVRNLDKAENYLNKYMKLTDDKLNAKIYLVDVLYLQKKYQAAIDSANQLMNQPINEETHARLYKLIGVSKMKMEDYQGAKESMDSYFANVKDENIVPFDYKTYADIMKELGNEDERLEYLTKYVDADTSTNVNFIRKTARDLNKDNSFKAAQLWFNKLFEVADSNQLTMADYYYRAKSTYGAALNDIGSYDNAVKGWNAFIKKYPDQPSGYFYKGRTLQMKDTGLVGLANDAYAQYIQKLKEDTSGSLDNKQKTLASIYSYGAKCAANQNDMEKAKTYMSKLLEIDPHNATVANIYGNLALKNLKAKNLAEAKKYANKALSIDENNSVAPQVLDYVKKMQDYQKKMEEYNKKKAQREAQQ